MNFECLTFCAKKIFLRIVEVRKNFFLFAFLVPNGDQCKLDPQKTLNGPLDGSHGKQNWLQLDLLDFDCLVNQFFPLMRIFLKQIFYGT